MPLYSSDLKRDRMAAIRDRIDMAPSPGAIELGTEGMKIILARIQLDKPCANVYGGILEFTGFPASTFGAEASGKIREARIVDGNGDVVVAGLDVGTTEGEVIMDRVQVTQGQRVTITSGKIIHSR